jgi:hypothetical protein
MKSLTLSYKCHCQNMLVRFNLLVNVIKYSYTTSPVGLSLSSLIICITAFQFYIGTNMAVCLTHYV